MIAMEYVEAGKVIRLGPQESIVMSYLHSCVRERIEGGVITVGREQSGVLSGKVERHSTTCDTEPTQLTTEIARKTRRDPVSLYRSQTRLAAGPLTLPCGTRAQESLFRTRAVGKLLSPQTRARVFVK